MTRRGLSIPVNTSVIVVAGFLVLGAVSLAVLPNVSEALSGVNTTIDDPRGEDGQDPGDDDDGEDGDDGDTALEPSFTVSAVEPGRTGYRYEISAAESSGDIQSYSWEAPDHPVLQSTSGEAVTATVTRGQPPEPEDITIRLTVEGPDGGTACVTGTLAEADGGTVTTPCDGDEGDDGDGLTVEVSSPSIEEGQDTFTATVSGGGSVDQYRWTLNWWEDSDGEKQSQTLSSCSGTECQVTFDRGAAEYQVAVEVEDDQGATATAETERFPVDELPWITSVKIEGSKAAERMTDPPLIVSPARVNQESTNEELIAFKAKTDGDGPGIVRVTVGSKSDELNIKNAEAEGTWEDPQASVDMGVPILSITGDDVSGTAPYPFNVTIETDDGTTVTRTREIDSHCYSVVEGPDGGDGDGAKGWKDNEAEAVFEAPNDLREETADFFGAERTWYELLAYIEPAHECKVTVYSNADKNEVGGEKATFSGRTDVSAVSGPSACDGDWKQCIKSFESLRD